MRCIYMRAPGHYDKPGGIRRGSVIYSLRICKHIITPSIIFSAAIRRNVLAVLKLKMHSDMHSADFRRAAFMLTYLYVLHMYSVFLTLCRSSLCPPFSAFPHPPSQYLQEPWSILSDQSDRQIPSLSPRVSGLSSTQDVSVVNNS